MDYKIDTRQLRIAMASKDINKSQLAENSGLSRGTVMSIFKGHRPAMGSIEKLSGALGLTPQQMADIFFCPALTQDVSLRG